MINVQHPTGWKPPIPESKGSLSALSSVASGNDFDQIEDLLPKPGEKAWTSPTTDPETISKPTSQPPEKPRFQQPVPPSSGSSSNPTGAAQDQPILPGQQWANPSTQQRKKLMLMIGSAVATVLLVAISIATIVRLSSETSDPDSDQLAAKQPTEPSDNPTSPAATDDSTTQPEPEKPNNDNEFLDASPTTSQLPIQQNANFDSPPPVQPSGSRFAAPVIKSEAPQPPTIENPPAHISDVPTGTESGTPSSESKTLQDLLRDRGILVDELADVATLLRSHEDSSLANISVTPVKTKNVNFERLLKLPIRQLDAPKGISLAHATRTITQLSGVPIAIDVRQISLMGLPANPTLELTLQDETALSAAEKIAELAGAKANVVGEGISISLPTDQQKANFKLKFPNVGDLNDEEKQRFLNSIQALIAPASWNHPTAPATIRYEEDTILLNSSTAVHRHITALIDRMNAAVELTLDPKNENAATAVASRWSASAPLRKQPTRWAVGPDLTLASFLNRIERLHGLTVMIDWSSVRATTDWTPLVQIPGELVEKEVGEAILQLSKAMNLRVIGIDAKTLLLTDPQTAYQSLDLEVYPLLVDWAGQAKPEEIEQVIFTALGQQVQDSFVRVVFEPKCSSLIVVAPQPIQHQVEKLINRLSQVDNAEGNAR